MSQSNRSTSSNGSTANDITTTARNAAYTVVGFGVLGFQRAQVHRRELQDWLERQPGVGTPISEVRSGVSRLVRDLDQRAEPALSQVEASLDRLEAALPCQTGQLIHQVRRQADGLRTELVSRLSA
ncbi:MAG TPA: hypothetical protein VE152_11190 [Acidimicrobiales bacterium]|jgi:hypothetical protein|nr:hypothetical protein [Acidimicrobiales bacterium]